MSVTPATGTAADSKHILTSSAGTLVVWVWSGTTWRLVDGAKDNTPDEMASGGWTYDKAL